MQIQNAIIIKPKTSFDETVARFGVEKQAEFYIQRNLDIFEKDEMPELKAKRRLFKSKVGSGEIQDLKKEKSANESTIDKIYSICSKNLKTKIIDKNFLPSYIFTEQDVVIVVGQDGLVANTAKYVRNIPIIGINPEPERYDGVLLPFQLNTFEPIFYKVLSNTYKYQSVTMAEAVLNDGQKILAFNDLFIGPRSHTSAKYTLTYEEEIEAQSSSGIIVSTGVGSTGWYSSFFNMVDGINSKSNSGISSKLLSSISSVSSSISSSHNRSYLFPREANELRFIVREPFISKTSSANIVHGAITPTNKLVIESNMANNGIIFSDGVESDFLNFNSGTIATIQISEDKAKLVC